MIIETPNYYKKLKIRIILKSIDIKLIYKENRISTIFSKYVKNLVKIY